jgi:hypothetical protein
MTFFRFKDKATNNHPPKSKPTTFGLEVTVNGTDIIAGAIFSELEIKTHGLTHDLTDGWHILDYDYPKKTFYRWHRCCTQSWTCDLRGIEEMPCPSSKYLFLCCIFHY